jgi:hypothetical protein
MNSRRFAKLMGSSGTLLRHIHLSKMVLWREGTKIMVARSMMKSKGVPGRFWAEAVMTAVYFLNKALTKTWFV